ncbi:MAG: hypothetical protein QM635_10205, partial [Microbacteriaceae bacterium]
MTTPDLDPIPAGSILLHVGMPKTGSTALQHALAEQRSALREHGLHYPGSWLNHRAAVYAFTGLHEGWRGEGGGGVPARRHWRRLRSEVRRSGAPRVLVSHEMISAAPVELRRAMIEELGRPAHVLLTLRNLAETLSSSYQQKLKAGADIGFGPWLHAVLDQDPAASDAPRSSALLQRGRIVREWAELVGPRNVTVVVLDRADRARVHRSVERLLALPPDLLAPRELSGRELNRSLTLPEAMLLRSLNRTLRHDRPLSWRAYEHRVIDGPVAALLERDAVPAEESRLATPEWAIERACAIAAESNAMIRDSGVRVVGDLAALATPFDGPRRVRGTGDAVPLEVAVAALDGAIRPRSDVACVGPASEAGGRAAVAGGVVVVEEGFGRRGADGGGAAGGG